MINQPTLDEPTLELSDEPARGRTAGEPRGTTIPSAEHGTRLVEVAVDSVGGGGSRSWTYLVPERLEPVDDGEAVLVPYGRRQALGVVLGEGRTDPGIEPRPIVDRVRADGPLLPPLALSLARWIASHYLAPPALVVRAMLPPEMLERLDLVAERRPGTEAGGDGLAPADVDLLEQLAGGPRAVRSLVAPDGRAGLVRRLRSLEGLGLVSLDWTLTAAGAGPRYERWVTAIGSASSAATGAASSHAPGAASGRAPGAPARGRPLGPRQQAVLAELATAPAEGVRAADLAARHGTSAVAGLARRGLVETEVRERPRRPLATRPVGRRGSRPAGTSLTDAQQRAVDLVRTAIEARDATPLLLDGVTGGGKTAIYVEAIGASLDAGRSALVLVPEISLALPLVDRLRADLEARVAIVHSGLAAGERADEWRRIRGGDVDIVVGTRLAALAPLADVGLVIVDEEHDPAWKSERTPRIQARDVAIRLGELAGAAVVLGSATPAVDSVGRVREGRYRHVRLPTRPSGEPPRIDLVDLRAELQAGNRGLFSSELDSALATLDPSAGDQAILVINRRGTASVVLCRDCGAVQTCPECTRPLVFHQAGMTLRCHHCGRAAPLASRCPQCDSPRIRYLGGGTERVERELRERFPNLRTGRLDRDVVERRDAAARVIDAFADGRLDVLVGTGLVTKGLDIPSVTLVGVVSADVALNLPDERAAERTYQLLAQAVGRAGRGERAGRAIIQTYQPGHPAIRAVVEANPDAFYDDELDLRRRFGSPPFGRLVKLTVALPDREAAEAEAAAMADRLRARSSERKAGVSVVGPAPAYIARRADRWRWNVVLRGPDPAALLDGGLEPPWTVDVDPESLL